MEIEAAAKWFRDEVMEGYESGPSAIENRFDRVLDRHLDSLVYRTLNACGFERLRDAPFTSLYVLADGGRSSRSLTTQDSLNAGAIGKASACFGKACIAEGAAPVPAVNEALECFMSHTRNARMENNWEYLDPDVTYEFLSRAFTLLAEEVL